MTKHETNADQRQEDPFSRSYTIEIDITLCEIVKRKRCFRRDAIAGPPVARTIHHPLDSGLSSFVLRTS